MTTPKSLAEYHQEKEAIVSSIAARWQPVADEIIRLELERHILGIRLEAAYSRLPARWKQIKRGAYLDSQACPGCRDRSRDAFHMVQVLMNETESVTLFEPICAVCGNLGEEQWNDRLGITQARNSFTR